ncbi:site-specific integrase [Streptomyces sp. NBC_01314]|uniref:site-specific integrase n=1 Tax=Streptomyces sp. NBC_01314 TaxID=2903821 RepID=UPI00309344CB|nr:site-specific integrase [Streptomyces sp. NBC_01314]
MTGWEDLEAREHALGLREQQPILVSPEGRVDPRLSECFRRSAFSAKSQGTQLTYAPLYRLFFTFLWQRGLNWDGASEDDVEDWEAWRQRGAENPAPVGGGTWAKELAALKLLYDIADKRGFVPVNPVTLPVSSDVKTSDVKWLSPRAFRLWRNVGLGGMLPSGLEDEARRGRYAGRDTAYADLLYSSGLRRREGGTLLTSAVTA